MEKFRLHCATRYVAPLICGDFAFQGKGSARSNLRFFWGRKSSCIDWIVLSDDDFPSLVRPVLGIRFFFLGD